MKKQFSNYAVIWAVCFVIFNVIAFAFKLMRQPVVFGPSFWIGFVFIVLTFIGQFVVTYLFFKDEKKEKVFLNIPILIISRSCLIASLIFGSICMIFDAIPPAVSVVLCVVVLGFYIISIMKAKSASDAVSEIDERVAQQTSFIKDLTVQAQNAVYNAKTDELKKMAEKVYEAVRYSNKSSHTGLEEIENKINASFIVFNDAVVSGNDAMANSIGEQVITLVNQRNELAKQYK